VVAGKRCKVNGVLIFFFFVCKYISENQNQKQIK
jgi:hypothetical protein